MSDLARATGLALDMMLTFGVAGPTPLIYRAPVDAREPIVIDPALLAEMHRLLQTILDRVKARLHAHREALIAIADQLLLRRSLAGNEIAAILNVNGGIIEVEPAQQDDLATATSRGIASG